MAGSPGTNVAGSSTTDGTSFTTASVDGLGWPVLAFVGLSQTTTGPRVPTLASVSGTGTWTTIGTGWSLDAATGKGEFAILGTSLSQASTITITKNASDTTILSCAWTFIPLIGALSVPSLYQGAQVSDADWDLADTQTATFGTTPKTNSKIFACGYLNITTDTLVLGSGLTLIETHNVSSASIVIKTSYTAGLAQSTVSYTQSSGDNSVGGVVAVEVPVIASSLGLLGAGY